VKGLKRILVIFLLLTSSLSAKIYFNRDGKKVGEANVLDVLILLDKFKCPTGKECGSISEYENRQGSGDPVSSDLRNAIRQEEAIVASSTIIRSIFDFLENSKNKKDVYKLEKELKALNETGRWLKYESKNGEFVIFIPLKKYPQLRWIEVEPAETVVKASAKKVSLEKIGLNVSEFSSMERLDVSFKKRTVKKQKKRLKDLERENQKNKLFLKYLEKFGLIDIKTLLNIFNETGDAKKIMKRVYLAGHGWYSQDIKEKVSGSVKMKEIKQPEESEAAIAQLKPNQYVKLMEKLNKVGCSLIYAATCYAGGWNAVAYQSASFYEQRSLFEKFSNIAKNWSFIAVSGGFPDVELKGGNQFEKFFLEINQFFEKQKDDLKNELKKTKEAFVKNKVCKEKDLEKFKKLVKKLSDKQVIRLEAQDDFEDFYREVIKLCKNDLKKISEVDLLTGELVKSIYGERFALIEQKPWMLSKIAPILLNVSGLKVPNYPSIRFPGIPFYRLSLEKIKRKEGEKDLSLYRTDSPSKYSRTKHMVLKYSFLLKHEIDERKRAKEEERDVDNSIKVPKGARAFEWISFVELYPSILDFVLKIPPITSIVSMIPGRAHHYVKGVEFYEGRKTTLDKISDLFYVSDSRKLFFLGSVKNIWDPGKKEFFKIKNYVCLIDKEKKRTKYIYKLDGKYYGNLEEGDLTKPEETIAKWIYETTPAQEALYEATGGIENERKFRRKINQNNVKINLFD